jgi:hypothetical protein
MGISPTLLTFFGGISAGTGVNLLTGLAESSQSHTKTVHLLASSAFWMVLAAALVAAATQIEKVRRLADLRTSANMSNEARKEIEDASYAQVRKKVRVAYGVALVCFIGALAILSPVV